MTDPRPSLVPDYLSPLDILFRIRDLIHQLNEHPDALPLHERDLIDLFMRLDQLLSDGKMIPNPWRDEIGTAYDSGYARGLRAMWHQVNDAVQDARPKEDR